MKKGISQEIIERVEAVEGMNIRDAVELRYIREFCSFRDLCALWKVNNRTVSKIILYCGFNVRHGGEAIAAQWVNNPERRKAAADSLAFVNHRLALEGRHVRQGKTKENSALIRSIAQKLKRTSSFLRPETKSLALKHSLRTRAEHPERMYALKRSPSACERVLYEFLKSVHIPFEFKKLFDIYVVDFYLPSLELAIDCMGSNRFPLSYQRHQSIAEKGCQIVYCVNSFNNWINSWRRNGWKRAKNKELENKDLIMEYDNLLKQGYSINLQYVKGHNETIGNELADSLATGALTAQEVLNGQF